MKKVIKPKKSKYPLLPIDYQKINYTPEELWKRSVEYFSNCDRYKKAKTLSWLCIHCWIGIWFFNENKESQQFSSVVAQINLILENYLEEQLLTGKNGTNVQFVLSNRFKGSRVNQSKMKVEATGVHPDVRETLDALIKRSKNHSVS